MRPLWVAPTAWPASGVITAITSTPSVVCIIRARSAPSAAPAAVLQATTSSLAWRLSSSSAICSEKRSISSASRTPYGKRPVSPRYRKSSCGSRTSSSCRTVSPPTPESKTAIGRSRGSGGEDGADIGAILGPDAATLPVSAVAAVATDRVDRVLELVDDRARDALGVEPRGEDDGGHHG